MELFFLGLVKSPWFWGFMGLTGGSFFFASRRELRRLEAEHAAALEEAIDGIDHDCDCEPGYYDGGGGGGFDGGGGGGE